MSTHLHKKSAGATVSHEDFVTSSIIRFGGLRNYIQEKLLVDYFAVEGNLGVARGLRFYLQNQKTRLEKLKQIRILDIGPAIGALSSLLILQELGIAGLLDKAKLILVDVSGRVIERTQKRDFEFPDTLIDKQFKSKILTKLRLSKGIVTSAHELPLKGGSIDICVASFLFHHLHDSIKKPASQEIQRVTKSSGFIGIAEEWIDNYDDYVAMHQDDEIPLAYESLITYQRLRGMFRGIEIFDAHNPIRRGKKNDFFYYFCGMKRAKLGTGPRKIIK